MITIIMIIIIIIIIFNFNSLFAPQSTFALKIYNKVLIKINIVSKHYTTLHSIVIWDYSIYSNFSKDQSVHKNSIICEHCSLLRNSSLNLSLILHSSFTCSTTLIISASSSQTLFHFPKTFLPFIW